MGNSEPEEKYISETLKNYIYPVLSENVTDALRRIKTQQLTGIEEIRIRVDKPLMIQKNHQDYFVCADGVLSEFVDKAKYATFEDIQRSIQLMSNFSVYSIGEELKQGFLTLIGGHRIGFTGRGVMENNELRLLKNISSLNIRIAREVKGCALPLIHSMVKNGIGNTLVISPPGFGKTTLLRDMTRILSNGDRQLGLNGYKVGVVDERSEIAGCHLGVPQRDVGVRTDVLDSCHKVKGIHLLLRSMSPEIIAVDEIGSIEDAEAIENAVNSGVIVIATAHGKNLEEAIRKKGIDRLINNRLLDYAIVLDRKNGPGTISEIIKF